MTDPRRRCHLVDSLDACLVTDDELVRGRLRDPFPAWPAGIER